LKADPAVRASRLVLTQFAARTLARALGLLGISVPDRM
jgi:arginyl-tRNA synthetase